MLLGVVRVDGSVAFIRDRLDVTREFLERAADGRALETRFRFASACIERACKQWGRGECSVPDRAAALLPSPDTTCATLPSCSIRDRCRWFDQRGSDACRICPQIVTRGAPQ
jgi:hypothetical protein